jgi:small subunit ribosomal protein S1
MLALAMPDKSSDSFASLFEAESQGRSPKKARPPALGERCRAEVVQIGKDCVFVELLQEGGFGKRAQAYLNHEDVRGPDGQLSAKLGDVIEAVVVEANGSDLRLGRTMGRPQGADELERAYQAGVAVEGKVSGVNKGGLEIEVAGMRAFCPMSQADRGYLADAQSLVGMSLSFLVTEFAEGGKRVVLSRRKLLEQEARAQAAQTREKLVPGAVLSGTVSSIREFGAFIDLGGIEGLLPNAELSYDRSANAAALLSPGDSVQVQVREVKEGAPDRRGEKTSKITLSLKALAADPWEQIEALAPVGKVLAGSVSRVLEFGAFVRLAMGVEGLLHVSELGGKVTDASRVLKPGEALHVVVRSVDRAARKISLAPAPEGLAVGAEARGPALGVGSIVQGSVDRVETYGVFLQIEGTRGKAGRGLVPNAELGTPRGSDTRKLFPVGTKLTAKVLETGEGKLRLSLRAVKDDEERSEFDGFRANVAAQAGLGTFADLLRKK